MRLSPEQLDFIRRHGITRCPPSPQLEMPWRSTRDMFATERDIILNFSQYQPVQFHPSIKIREARRRNSTETPGG